jgi:ankyrin repeat protein
VDALIAAGANVNAAAADGSTPLYFASLKGDKSMVDALIAAGANVNARINDGSTPLYIASRNGHTSVVDALIRAGANVNVATAILGLTPLYIASFNRQPSIVRLLLSKGADILSPIKGKSIFQNAKERKFTPEINQLIIDHEIWLRRRHLMRAETRSRELLGAPEERRNSRRGTRRLRSQRRTRRSRRN